MSVWRRLSLLLRQTREKTRGPHMQGMPWSTIALGSLLLILACLKAFPRTPFGPH